jgi:hypothetical protein
MRDATEDLLAVYAADEAAAIARLDRVELLLQRLNEANMDAAKKAALAHRLQSIRLDASADAIIDQIERTIPQ